jgi:hypothetical protein
VVRFSDQRTDSSEQLAVEETAAGKQSFLFLAKKYSDLK